ncbi:CHAT domain-containing protein [cf. Phormidesmis sp. LEGE 11477]|uniref:CHAT domain-containing protein n=1 Tax=cf. Phormidesmis sp. LEGE 11477 TaxID=1828680 RepID=UPI00187DF5C3|nr:CHAT domain-containing protein [cf. Phormidesmis sp. LEGE 11477]MBE9063057.1 CHAT domain-containing protein [cf. Phormidesmis sp. LEGE 11477]
MSGTRDIHIGGNVDGAAIIVGDRNTVTSQQVSSQQLATPSSTPSKRKLLILAANPQGSSRLRLDQEVRDISEGLKRAEHRDKFEIAQRWAVRPRDFQRAMLEELPQIVHFSGHGEGEEGLYFEDEAGAPKLVSGSALASLFKLFAHKANIECVVLNGCYSSVQAAAITQHIPYAIGMSQAVGDKAAIEFVVGFYDALGNGESVEFAFESGKVSMELNGTGYEDLPVLMINAPT